MSPDSGSGRIVAGIDGSPEAEAALAWAVEEARAHSRPLQIIYAFPALVSIFGTTAHDYFPQVQKEAEAVMERAVAAVPAVRELEAQQTLVPGNPSEVLVEQSRGASLLVVGYRGRGSFRGMLLGSVSMHCVHQAHCPVVVVRGED